MRALAAAEAATLATALGLTPERLPGFAWSHANLAAWTDEASLCLHRGSAFADDWIREVWIVAPPGQLLAATRRYCRQLFASGARQLRWSVPLPVDPRHEAVWSRYGVAPISISGDVLTVALDDPSLPPSSLKAWPKPLLLGMGLRLGVARYGELTQIAAWAELERNYRPLGYTRPVPLQQLVASIVPENPLHHARLRTHVYVLRRHGAPVGAVFERQRDYEGDVIHEIDIVMVDETLPLQAWAQSCTLIGDICFRRGTTRIVINVREAFDGLAAMLGGEPATRWIARSETTRTHYTSTPTTFYPSLFARRYLRHRVQS